MANIVYETVQKPLEERILLAACNYWGVPDTFFSQKRGNTEDVRKRHTLFYLLKNEAELPESAISERFGISNSSLFEAMEKINFQKTMYRKLSEEMKMIMVIAHKLDVRMIHANIQFITAEDLNKE